jgi:xylulokinase
MFLLGIDVGTGGAKAILIEPGGAVRGSATRAYPLSSPRPRWSEQDPLHWWQATAAAVAEVLRATATAPRQVAAAALTGQMHGLVLLDRGGEVVRPAILWNDQRTAAECAAIHARVGLERVRRITGKPALPGFTAPKVLWVRAHEPHIFEAAATMLLPKDYVRYRLSGALASDVADASGTSLFDVAARRWSPELIEALDVPRSWLPEVFESPEVVGSVGRAGAAATGLLEGTPICAGAGDQAAEAVGCGIVGEGSVSVTIGTSGVVFAATAGYRVDPGGGLHAYCHAVPGMWHLMGVMLSAGGSLRWYRDALCPEEAAEARRRGVDPYDLILEPAAAVPAGSEGLFFLPYLTGERTPHADPDARGAFVGLTLRHSRPHLTRAVLEGVAFGLRDCLNLVRGIGLDTARIRLSGGGARSPLWRQILADVFAQDVVRVRETQGAAYGAAILAGVAAGCFPGVAAAAEAVVGEAETTRPGAQRAAYGRAYDGYRDLYPALAPFFRAPGATPGEA